MKKFVVILLCLIAFSCSSSYVENGTVYFLASEFSPYHNDSYILPLNEISDINLAREIIKNPNSVTAKIIVAKILKGSGINDYINKDLIQNKIWSWHISRFIGFAKFTAEILDGSPTMVEENLDEWLHNTDSSIGFWQYTITREIDRDEMF